MQTETNSVKSVNRTIRKFCLFTLVAEHLQLDIISWLLFLSFY